MDTYLKNTFFPGISDPVLLEIRRERQVELALEGFRFNDLKRWKSGELMAKLAWTGIYIPALDKALDLDHDGTADVLFYDGNKPEPNVQGVTKVKVGGTKNSQTMTADNHLEWGKTMGRMWYEDDKQYFYPIPSSALVLNNKLGQNPGW